MTAPSTGSLSLQFVNNTGLPDSSVFITFQNPALGSNNLAVTYGQDRMAVPFAAPGNIMSTSLSLQAIGSGGFTVTKASGVVIFVSYGAALSSTTSVPSYIGSGGSDYLTQFQPFELTRTGGSGDQGNLTNINYFTAPIQITSYNGGSGGTQLQTRGFTQGALAIGTLLGAVSGNSPSAVITNGAGGSVLRYIGPSSYGPADVNPYPSFDAYLTAVNTAGQATSISNHNAFNVPVTGGPGSTNYDFTLNLSATVGADNSIQMAGSISTTITPYGGAATAGQTFADCSVTISAQDANALNFTIYGQAISSSVSFGSGWTALGNYMESVGLSAQGALNTTQNLAIGEITSGLLGGFVNSATMPTGQTRAIKDLPSSTWWTLNPTVAFSQIQANSACYNQYANIIYTASGNEAYSIPYSDRLGSGPLINSVQFNGTPVDTWVVKLSPPVA
jgi:hypothetical protein